MQILQKASSILNKKSTYFFLLSVTVFISIILFVMNKNVISGDHYTYLYYVKGLENGRYTYWYFLKDYVPDTFRNPGYPLFLYVLHFLSDALLLIQITQWGLLMAALWMMLKIMEHYDNSLIVKNLFLLLVCYNFVVLSYSSLIYPETLVLFLVTLLVYLEIRMEDNGWTKVVVLSLLYGYCFQVRPVILFIPFLRFFYFLFKKEKLSFLKNATFLFLFIATLLPYGFWNLKHHHQFKITPLEGGGGALYLGYWSPKMMGYLEDRYWRNIMYEDLLFNFTEKEEVPENVRLFNNEWDSIERLCSKYLTAQDSVNMNIMKQVQYTNLFPTYSSRYTAEREEILKTLATQHYVADWKYTLKLKTYTFFRIWYSGYNLKEEYRKTPLSTVASMLAFIATFSTLLLTLIYFIYMCLKDRRAIATLMLPLLLCLYFGFFHTPFTIQSRYTIPVRLFYIFTLSFMIYSTHFKKYPNEPYQNI